MDLSLDHFSGAVGEQYRIVFPDGELPLVLETAQPLPRSMRDAGAFRLEWRGPVEPVVAQGTYRLVRDDDTFDMFIVPVGRDQRGTLYEAIFN
ncbi:MAG: hypothetical protein JOZ90_15825 [Alphaproteobacteria bacterium]|nr:hypothetical protein [Alphaproteobacteria bacterium]MBV9373415.1 hypothetical protein [Alphaproteobacteria bacterium]MBV9902543.1 hypothetical protein [Alphaproteobacteria bacterium]